MNKLYLYGNGSAKNHGCEAITRSTIKILKSDNNEFRTASYDLESDKIYGLDLICELIDTPIISDYSIFRRLFYGVVNRVFKYNEFRLKKQYINVIKEASNCTLALSIGGDNFCYKGGAETQGYLAKSLKKKGLNTVLWGCSIEPEVIKSNVGKNALSHYDLIITRESISYNALLENGFSNKVKLYPDPAFQLDKIDLTLPAEFVENNTVGINVSPLIDNYESQPGITLDNYRSLIKYILSDTTMSICLISHVEEDIIPLEKLYNEFKDTNRISLINNKNCMVLKGYISRCRFFIGARTHATIAAYSTCVPTLVVGYSVKALGIARDIFGNEENMVIPVQSLIGENDLINAFKYITNNEEYLRNHLINFIPEYKAKAAIANLEIEKLLNE